MDFDKALSLAEELIEEKTQCSVESLRDFGSRIKYFTNRFSTNNIFGNGCMSDIIKKITKLGAKEGFTSEKCIERDFQITKICTTKDDKLQKEVCKAEALWATIQYGIIPLENFWCMEYKLEDGENLTENEIKILNYMKDIAKLYLEETKKLKPYIEKANKVGC